MRKLVLLPFLPLLLAVNDHAVLESADASSPFGPKGIYYLAVSGSGCYMGTDPYTDWRATAAIPPSQTGVLEMQVVEENGNVLCTATSTPFTGTYTEWRCEFISRSSGLKARALAQLYVTGKNGKEKLRDTEESDWVDPPICS